MGGKSWFNGTNLLVGFCGAAYILLFTFAILTLVMC
ncbi:uncharacterized protein LOC121529893 [Drosophila eugracilis]|nr:uncharacterized protein LOC121529893 [Drosophila eugracilis]